ncbi:hypothetical protein GF324_00145 [bacterium]|nr:hypothetical protein [bacterium]
MSVAREGAPGVRRLRLTAVPVWVWVAVLIGLVMRTASIATVPLHQGGNGPPAFNDELSHLQHIRYLGTVWSVPDQRMNIGDPAAFTRGEVEYHQPPLYYMMSATLLRALPVLRTVQVPLLRGLSLLFWVVALWILLRSLPDARMQAPLLFASTLPAVSILPSAYISNDALLAVFVALMYARSADLVRDGWSTGRAVELGLAGALGAWTKLSAVTLWPMLALAAFQVRPGNLGQKLGGAAIPMTAAFIGTLPLWVQRTLTYGEPLSFSFASKGLTFQFRTAFAAAYHSLVAPWLEYWASPLVKLPALVLLTALIVSGAAGIALRQRIRDRVDERTARVLALWVVGAGVATLAWAVYGFRFHQTESRLLLPAAPGLAVLLGWPLWVWTPDRQRLLGWALVLLLSLPYLKWGGIL